MYELQKIGICCDYEINRQLLVHDDVYRIANASSSNKIDLKTEADIRRMYLETKLDGNEFKKNLILECEDGEVECASLPLIARSEYYRMMLATNHWMESSNRDSNSGNIRVNSKDILTEEARQYITSIAGAAKIVSTLRYTLTTQYQRTTIVDLHSQTRITCDEFLTCTDWENNTLSLPMIILETKSSQHPSPFDVWLWNNRHRPNRISKYCTTLAVLHPDLPSNKWHQTIKNYYPAPVG